MHPSIIRQIHASRIFHMIRLNPSISQSELVEQSGLDRSTVSTIVKQFEDRSLVKREARANLGRPGRPGEGLSIDAGAGLLAGAHLQPGTIRFGLTGLDGSDKSSCNLPMPDSVDKLPQVFKQGVATLVKRGGFKLSNVLALGVTLPGLVTREGHVAQSPNFAWKDLDLRALLAPVLPFPMTFDNNTNAAAIAEHLFGAARDHEDFVFLASGTGSGAGLFLNGELYRGAGNYGGELGHMKIVPNGRLCRCGAAGCLSAYVSNTSILARLEQRGRGFDTITDVVDAARAGEAVVLSTLAEAGTLLGIGLANIVNIFNPPLIVLGGGLALLQEYLRSTMMESLSELALAASLRSNRIEPAMLAAESAWGALALALQDITNANASAALWSERSS